MREIMIWIGIGGAVATCTWIFKFLWHCIVDIPTQYKKINFVKLMSKEFIESLNDQDRPKIIKIKKTLVQFFKIWIASSVFWLGATLLWAEIS